MVFFPTLRHALPAILGAALLGLAGCSMAPISPFDAGGRLTAPAETAVVFGLTPPLGPTAPFKLRFDAVGSGETRIFDLVDYCYDDQWINQISEFQIPVRQGVDRAFSCPERRAAGYYVKSLEPGEYEISFDVDEDRLATPWGVYANSEATIRFSVQPNERVYIGDLIYARQSRISGTFCPECVDVAAISDTSGVRLQEFLTTTFGEDATFVKRLMAPAAWAGDPRLEGREARLSSADSVATAPTLGGSAAEALFLGSFWTEADAEQARSAAIRRATSGLFESDLQVQRHVDANGRGYFSVIAPAIPSDQVAAICAGLLGAGMTCQSVADAR